MSLAFVLGGRGVVASPVEVGESSWVGEGRGCDGYYSTTSTGLPWWWLEAAGHRRSRARGGGYWGARMETMMVGRRHILWI